MRRCFHQYGVLHERFHGVAGDSDKSCLSVSDGLLNVFL